MQQGQGTASSLAARTAPRRRKRISPGRLVGFAGIIVFGLVIVVPFFFMLTTSIKSASEAWRVPITWTPQSFTLDHYRYAIQEGFFRALLNGAIYAGLGTILVVYASALLGFVIVKLPSKFGNFFFWLHFFSHYFCGFCHLLFS